MRKSEDSFAAWFGKRQPLSGAGLDKGDVVGENTYQGLLGEDKYTDKASFLLSLKIIEKTIREARMQGMSPVWRINFSDKKQIICIEENVFRKLMEK